MPELRVPEASLLDVEPPLDSVESYFTFAHEFTEEFYSAELLHYRNLAYPESATPDSFWREYIWCVYVSGFNSQVVARLYDSLLNVYGPWDSSRDYESCWRKVSNIVSHHRAAISMETHTEEEVGEDIGKVNIADVVITLNQTKEELHREIMRLFLAKNRNGKRYIEIPIQTAFERMAFYEPLKA